MAENYDLIFGQSASKQYGWSDSDYQNGWQTVSSTPPAAEQFDALQRRSDTKAKDLNDRLSPLETTASKALARVTPAANMLPYFNSGNSATTTAISNFIKTLLDDGDAATARATLGANAQNCGGIVAASLKNNGYAKFANGLILEWGEIVADVSPKTVTLPISMKVVTAMANEMDRVVSQASVYVNIWESTSTIEVYSKAIGQFNTVWLAIGY